jgi:prolyl-tRNA editing enzyme YbaK/EbsC (Cys-tRNA(Pro) deacylase)
VPAVDRPRADVVKKVTGFAIGGVAPVAHPAPLRTLIDVSLARFDVVWAAAGHPHAVFPTRYDELVRITGGTPAEVA